MNIFFRVSLEVDKDRVKTTYSVVDVVVETAVVKKQSQRRVFALKLKGEIVKIVGGGFHIIHSFSKGQLFQLGTDCLEVGRNRGKVVGNSLHIAQHRRHLI